MGKAGNNISFSGARGLGKGEISFPFPVHVPGRAEGAESDPFLFPFSVQEVVQGTYSLVEGRVWMGGVCVCSPNCKQFVIDQLGRYGEILCLLCTSSYAPSPSSVRAGTEFLR